MYAQQPSVTETEEDIQVAFNVIDEVPIFPGCEDSNDKRTCFQDKIQQHVAANLKYPEEAFKKKRAERVVVTFKISSEGDIIAIETYGKHEILKGEAKRIVSLLPKMIAGKQRGKAVPVPYAVPITFKLQ